MEDPTKKMSPDLLAMMSYHQKLPPGSYRERYGKELNAALEAFDARNNTEPATQTTFSAAEMMKLPAVEWLVPGFIPRTGLTQLTAASGAGKSFVALDWAIEVALQEKSVLYVIGEGWNGMGARMRAWQFANPEMPRPNQEQLLFMPPQRIPDLTNAESVEKFIADVRDELAGRRYDLIIFDTLARAMTGNESDNEVMGTAVKACAHIQNELGGAVLLIHHMGWDGDHQRGGSALYGACDSVVYMKVEDPEQKISKVWVPKTKDGRSGDDFYVQMYAPNSDEPDEGAIKRVDAPDRQSEFEARVLDALESYGPIKQTDLRALLACKNERLVATLLALQLRSLAKASKGPNNANVWDLGEGTEGT